MSAPVVRMSKSGNSIGMDIEPEILAERDPSSADSLVSRNEPDELENEQTWPTEEEMHVTGNISQASGNLPDAKTGTTPKSVRRIPKGMSEYQASWIIDSDEEEDGDEETDSDSGEMDTKDVEEEEAYEVADAEEPEMETESRKSVTFQDLDIEEEAKQFEPSYTHISGVANLQSTGCKRGEIAIVRRKMTPHSLTNSTLPKIFPRGSVSSVSGA